MLALDVIFGSSILPGLLGIMVGHLYYFFTVLHPLASGKNYLKTPMWVYPYCLWIIFSQLSDHSYLLTDSVYCSSYDIVASFPVVYILVDSLTSCACTDTRLLLDSGWACRQTLQSDRLTLALVPSEEEAIDSIGRLLRRLAMTRNLNWDIPTSRRISNL